MTILLLGDLTGRSRVALRMLTGELENRGHEVLALPTALISNTLNLGRAAIADTTDYLLEALETWETLGLSYDLLEIELLHRLCDRAGAGGKALPGGGCGARARRARRGRSDSGGSRQALQQRERGTGRGDGAAHSACRYHHAEFDGGLPDGGAAV